MSVAPKRGKRAGFSRTIAVDESTGISLFLMDHGFDRDFEEYVVWVNRRRVGPSAWIEPGDRVTIGPRSIRKVRPHSAMRPTITRPGKREETVGEMVRRWAMEDEQANDPGAFEAFKKAINETRARAGARILYP